MTTPAELFEHHLVAFAAGDIDEIVRDYSSDAVMVYGDRVWRGQAGARDFFAMWLDDLLPPGCDFEVTNQITTEDLVYITWKAESPGYKFDFGTNTFVVTGDRFSRQTVATRHKKK